MLKDNENQKLHLGVMLKKKHMVCSAHRLMNHPGACKNLHGHNYGLEYEIFCRAFDHEGTGMVMDFATVKEYVCGMADAYLDHKVILQKGDPLIEPLQLVLGNDQVLTLPYPPTAENLAAMILVNTNKMLREEFKGEIFCQKVTVEETPNNSAYAMHEAE
jgi:6-pyruvoyltetrahydropterin/6-carboxytetrahydropterin synthase